MPYDAERKKDCFEIKIWHCSNNEISRNCCVGCFTSQRFYGVSRNPSYPKLLEIYPPKRHCTTLLHPINVRYFLLAPFTVILIQLRILFDSKRKLMRKILQSGRAVRNIFSSSLLCCLIY